MIVPTVFRLKCKTGRALGKMIKTVSTLEELNLEDNEIGEEGATAIALGIQCETAKLKSLNISQNIIGDNGGVGNCLKSESIVIFIYIHIAPSVILYRQVFYPFRL